MRRKTKLIFSTLIYLGILIFVQLPVFQAGKHYYTIYELYSYAKGVTDTGVFSVQIGLLCVYQIACILSFVVVFLNKNWHVNIIGMFLGLLQVAVFFEGTGSVTENILGNLYPLILVMMNIIECLIPAMANAMKESEQEAKRSVERDRIYKEEKRRRLYFEGNYPKLFLKVMMDNFFYYRKDYLLLGICGLMISAFTLVGLGTYEILKIQHKNGSFLMGTGLGRIVFNALLPIGICSVILMIGIVITYLKRRFMSYSMLLVLGARKKTLYIMMLFEIGLNFLVSLFMGWILGNAILYILRGKIIEEIDGIFVVAPVTWITYIKSLGVFFLIYILALIIANEITRDFNIFSVSARNKREERIPRKGIAIFLIVGLMILIWSLFSYSRRYNFEDIKLIGIGLIGVFFMVRYGMALYLRRLKKAKNYLTKLMDKNQLYHKSRTTSWYFFAIALVNTCALFYFCFQAISVDLAENADELYPYDYVCIADENDKKFFGELEEKYSVKITSYPMVRVASSDGTSGVESPVTISPQGQHIGISETTYNKLRGELQLTKTKLPDLDENGKKIYVVYQQDRSVHAQPLDFQFPRSSQRLHIGLPCEYYSKTTPERITGFPKREIVGSEVRSLIGAFGQGTQENIVVFSDDYFEKAEEMWKKTDSRTGKKILDPNDIIPGVTIRQGPTRLVLIQAEASQIDELEKEMEALRDNPNHVYEEKYSSEVKCYYSKSTSIIELQIERILRKVTNYLVVGILVFSYIFLMLIKTLSEMEERQIRAKFLRDLGMSKKDRYRVWRKEIWRFLVIPGLISLILTGVFTSITFYLRSYSWGVIQEYLQHAVVIWGVCVLVEVAATAMSYKLVIYKVEGKRYE